MLIEYWWWWWGNGGSGGESHCQGGRCNSCKNAIVECIISYEHFGAGGGDCGGGGGGGGCDGSGIGGVGGKYNNQYKLFFTLLPLPTSQMSVQI